MQNKNLDHIYAYDLDYDFNKKKTIISLYRLVLNQTKNNYELEYIKKLCEKENTLEFIHQLRHSKKGYGLKSLNEYGFYNEEIPLVNLPSAKIRLLLFKYRTKVIAKKFNEVIINGVLYFDTYIYYLDALTGELFAYQVSRNIYTDMLEKFIKENYTLIDDQELKNINQPLIRRKIK